MPHLAFFSAVLASCRTEWVQRILMDHVDDSALAILQVERPA